ncbi:MAG: M20 family metallopeptidase [Gammaproteobacteria bacterium]
MLKEHSEGMASMLARLVEMETPSTVPESQRAILDLLSAELGALDFRVRRIPGRKSGGHLFARPQNRGRKRPAQLLLGHCDTVWPIGTLKEMPLTIQNGILRGPGGYDMKAGLVQMIFALQAIRRLDLRPDLDPLVFINSDEEIGSFESTRYIRALSRSMRRSFVLEPSLGQSGRIKTARKGVGRFTVTVTGKAAHAGLNPEQGASAILELSHVIQRLFALNDVERGITVNVGMIDGGLRANVIAPESKAIVDVRVLTAKDAAEVEHAIRNLQPVTPGVNLHIEGRIGRPPLEPTEANRRLWTLARELAKSLDWELEEGTAGGGSDGNTTSLYNATLDGLGAVGDGAHARHEFVDLSKMPERTALLALLLLSPESG